ncbi:MAG: exosortase [Pseudomonadota bacterium]
MTSPDAPGAAAPRASLVSRVDWRSWRIPAALVAVVVLTGALYWPSTASLLHEWFEVPSSAYRHGSLIVAIALWLLARKVHTSAVAPAPEASRSAWPLLALVAASFVWLVGFRAGIQVAHQAMLPVIIWLTVLCVFGKRIATAAVVPVGLMYSAIPIWHVIVPALQGMTIAVVSGLLRVVGIPAYVTGDFVHIRSGIFHVEDGCAGLHYFIVAATIAVLFGELREDRLRTRVYLFGLAIALALVSNWLRVFIIIVAGDLTNMQHYLVRVDHSTFGWVVFGFAMVAFLLLGRLRFLNVAAPEIAVEAAPTRAGQKAGSALRGYTLAALAAAVGPAWLMLMPARGAAGSNVSVPAAIAGWSGPLESCHGRWRPRYDAADLKGSREFSRAGVSVCFFSATYLTQHQDKELIGYFSSIYDPDSDVVSAGARQVAGRTVNEAQLGDETAGDRIVWYAYVVGVSEMRRGVEAQLSYALGSLHGAPAASVYAISALCVPDCAAARAVLTDFLPHVRVGAGASDH